MQRSEEKRKRKEFPYYLAIAGNIIILIILESFSCLGCKAWQSQYRKSSCVIARHKFELGSISYMSFFGPPSSPSYDKKKYEHLTLAIRQTVLERAHNRCQKCRVKFSPRTPQQFEHINGSLKDNRPVNLHALCSECFKSVENKEKNKKGIFGRMRNIVG